MPFKKGQSGNPGGRPKVFAELRARAQEQAPAILEKLIAIALDDSSKAQAAAARTVLGIAGVPMNAPEDVTHDPKQAPEQAAAAKTEALEADLGPKVELN